MKRPIAPFPCDENVVSMPMPWLRIKLIPSDTRLTLQTQEGHECGKKKSNKTKKRPRKRANLPKAFSLQSAKAFGTAVCVFTFSLRCFIYLFNMNPAHNSQDKILSRLLSAITLPEALKGKGDFVSPARPTAHRQGPEGEEASLNPPSIRERTKYMDPHPLPLAVTGSWR